MCDHNQRLRALEIEWAAVNEKMEIHNELTRQHIREQKELNKKFFELINGQDDKPGLKGRVDRIEQRNRLVTWFASIAIIAWITEIVRNMTGSWHT